MKKLKIFYIILGIYLFVSFSFFIYNSIFELPRTYANGMWRYVEQNMCYECAHGLRSSTCPKIQNINQGIKVYPTAKQYNGEYDAKFSKYVKIVYYENSQKKTNEALADLVKSGELENFIVSHISCGSGAWDERKINEKYLMKRPEKKKSY